MGVEAARARPARRAPAPRPTRCWFATVAPAYLDKTNATAIHAALRLARRRPGLRPRRRRCAPAVGALRAALDGAAAPRSSSPPTSAPGCPAGADEAAGGDARRGAARRRRRRRPVLAELLGGGVGHRGVPRPLAHARRRRARRCGRSASARPRYVPLGEQAWHAALKARRARPPSDVDRVVVTGTARPRGQAPPRPAARRRADAARRRPHRRRVGNTGAAQPGAAARRRARGRRARARSSRSSSLADGADVLLFRTTDALAVVRAGRARSPTQVDGRRAGRLRHVPHLARHAHRRAAPPPRAGPRLGVGRRPHRATGSSASSARRDATPAPCTCRRARVAATAARSTRWSPAPMADVPGTIATFTVDRLAYSPSPPVVFAVVDFDGGGRLPVRAHRRRPRRGRDRRPGRDDVPPALHRRRHPQLLLEGPPRAWRRSADGVARHPRPRRDRRHGLHRRSASTGTRAPTTCSSTPPTRRFAVGRRRPRTTSTPTGSAPRSRA